MPKKTLSRMMTMAKRGSIIMKSTPLDELEDEKDDGKKETLFFNKGKKINFKDEYSEGESGSMFPTALTQLKKSA